MRKHLRPVDDGDIFCPRRCEVRHLLFDGRGHDERGAVRGDAAPVLGEDFDPEGFELLAHGAAFPMVEGAVTAADASDHDKRRGGEKPRAEARLDMMKNRRGAGAIMASINIVVMVPDS